MKVWKIVSGIISIAISLFVVFQSRFAALYDILSGNGQASGIAGMMVAAMLVSGGIVSIVTRNGNRGGDIAMTFLYSLGAFVGFLGAGSYTDLYIWAGWCAVCVIFAIADCILLSRSYSDDEAVSTPVRTTTPVRTGPVTFQDVILETDPQRRDAAIDALPERQAKNYLKQALNVLVPRQAAGDDDDDGLVKTLIAILVVLGVFIVGVIVVGIITSTPKDRRTVDPAPPIITQDVQPSEEIIQTASPTSIPDDEAASEPPDMTMGQRNALREAQSYLRSSPFSYTRLIEQLEYAQYSTEDATFAVDNCGADWYEQAAREAERYLRSSAFSRDRLIEQLEYAGYTYEQAVYGVEQNGY